MEVYGDLLFLINFSMDFLCGYLTVSLLHRPRPVWRLFLAAVLGGFYAVVSLFLDWPSAAALVGDVLVCVGMCGVIFPEKGMRVRFFGLCCLVYTGISMAMGGMMTALFELINRLALPLDLFREKEDRISTWLFALLALVSAMATMRGGKFLRRSAARRTARLEIDFCGRHGEMTALVDNGNMCRDPLDGRPVIFLSPGQGRFLLGEAGWQKPEQMSPELARRFRLVPTQTVEGKGICRAFIPDAVYITDGSGRHAAQALVALAEELDRGRDYQAIISPDLVS